SGFVQWWFSTDSMLPEMIGCVALGSVAAHYLALSSRRAIVVAAAVVLAVCLVDFALYYYPPFQVPLFYFGLAVVAGSLGPRLRAIAGRDGGFRAGCLAAAGVLAALLVVLDYLDARTVIGMMRGTTYPGTRMSVGGDVSVAQVFGGLYGFFMSE